MAKTWRAAGLQVSEAARPPQWMPESAHAGDLWPAALLALCLGIGLEWRLLSGSGSPSPFVLAGLFGLVFLTAVVSRRLRMGQWLPLQAGLVDLIAQDPSTAAGPAPATLWIVTRSDTPATPSAEWVGRLAGRLDWVWLALLVLPGFYFGPREWLARSSPALLVGLAGLAILRRVDAWSREPFPYPADNRTGLGLVAELSRTLGPALRGRLDVRYALLATSNETLGPLAGSLLAQTPIRTGSGPVLVVLMDAPGVGPGLELTCDGPLAALGAEVARDLWLPITPRPDLSPTTRGRWTWLTLMGSTDPSARLDPAVLGAAAQWLSEVALRFARQAGSEAQRDPATLSQRSRVD
jgi:hypothetical protein